ncbi:MAG: alpha/beta fold hydrolase [Crocinitomicaceae bacterium]|nr:alpha/beta fold hydrolase [Crocinitomicaceae bacterium]
MPEKVSFLNESGQTLAARLELPDGEPIGFALFAHCFTCNKDLTALRNISRALMKSGIAVLRFDFTGLGESEGDFEITNFSSNVDDLICAADFMKENYQAPSILIGHSLGGAAVIFAANRIESVTAVATIGAPSDPNHVAHLFGSGIDKIKEEGEARLLIGGRKFNIQKQFLDDINDKNMSSTLKKMRKPLLVMHSPQDTVVEIENAAKIYQDAWHPKSFVSLDGADHLLSDRRDSVYVGNMVATWSERYLG